MGKLKDLEVRCEEAACRYLDRQGYEVLERGWGHDGQSVDFVAVDERGALVFLDLLVGNTLSADFPAEKDASTERERFERVALAYADENPLSECTVRFDVLSCVPRANGLLFLRHHLGAYSAN